MRLRQDCRLLQGPGEKESWARVFLGSLGLEVGNIINILLVLCVFIHVELKKKKGLVVGYIKQLSVGPCTLLLSVVNRIPLPIPGLFRHPLQVFF